MFLSRDGQKAAKQAIFALHRQDAKKAKTLIDECEEMIQKDLVPITVEEPLLRQQGCLVGVMEEYAEAKLFYSWLYGDSTELPDKKLPQSPSAKLLTQDDFAPVELTPVEYLGGTLFR